MAEQNHEREAIIIALHLTPLIYLTIAAMIFACAFVLQRKQHKQAISQIELKAYEVQVILLERITLQNNLLTQLRKQLHDSPCQLLFVAKINLSMIEEQAQAAEYLPYIKKTNELISQSIQELRTLMKRMEEEAVPGGKLINGIKYIIEKIKNTSTTETSLLIRGQSYSLPNADEIILLKAVEEVLACIMKPTEPSEIQVVLNFSGDDFQLNITTCYHNSIKSADIPNFNALIHQLEIRCRLIDFDYRFKQVDNHTISFQLLAKPAVSEWYLMPYYW